MAEEKNKEEEMDDNIDDHLLADGFSVVDSTIVDGNQDATEKKDAGDAGSEGKKSKSTADSTNGTKEEGSKENSTKTKSEIPKEAKQNPEDVKEESSKKVKTSKPTSEKDKDKKGSTEKKTIKEEPSDNTEKSNGQVPEPKEDSLIISAEEDLEITVNTSIDNPDEVKPDSEPKNENESKNHRKSGKINYMWVSNIPRTLKATDLKKFFSKQGKVLTAKIVTNGKSLFGYVSMETPALAEQCIKKLNNTSFAGKKIVLSSERPDSKRPTKLDDDKKSARSSKVNSVRTKKPEKVEPPSKPRSVKSDPLTKVYEPSEKGEESKKAPETKPKKIEVDWRREYEMTKTELSRCKRRMLDYQRRTEDALLKCRNADRDLRLARTQLRDERKKAQQERDHLEKKIKLESVRFEADRAILNKELDEVRRLREHLKTKIAELKERQDRLERQERRLERPTKPEKPRSITPERRRGASGQRYRHPQDDETAKRKWASERHRTPPPAPKLSESSSRKRTTDGRHYYDEKKPRRTPPPEYSFDESRGRHRTSFPPDAKPAPAGPPSRGAGWEEGPYSQNMAWRLGPSGAPPSQTFPPTDRYQPGFPPASSSSAFPAAARDPHYYPPVEYSKHYNGPRKY